VSLAKIKLPESLERLEFEEETFIGCNLDSIVIAQGNRNYVVDGNSLLDIDRSRLIRGCNSSVIPDTVKEICDNAFSGCTRLEEIAIPDSVKIIGRGAFKGCTSLRSIDIPNSVEKIYIEAFSGCINLQDIKIENSTTFDPSSSFRDCPCAKEKGLYDGMKDELREIIKKNQAPKHRR